MKELKLVKEKTPVEQIKASEIDLTRHIVFFKGLVHYYVLVKMPSGRHAFINPIGGEVFSEQEPEQTLDEFLFKGEHKRRIFEL